MIDNKFKNIFDKKQIDLKIVKDKKKKSKNTIMSLNFLNAMAQFEEQNEVEHHKLHHKNGSEKDHNESEHHHSSSFESRSSFQHTDRYKTESVNSEIKKKKEELYG